YMSMSAYFESIGLKGFAHWMHMQAKEETIHALKFYNYIHSAAGRVTLKQIAGPPTEWKSPVDVFEDTYKHEVKVTGLIHDLVDLAIKEKDHATNAFLQWFVTEQVEEEESANDALQKLKLVGDDRSGLFMLDREMATRIFTPPPGMEAPAV
ncbi:MAG TPA: ferritin, partial [bacterium]|nr:ferritin [bacterium]